MMPFRVALAVQNCPAGQFEANLAKSLKLARSAADQGADMIVFPEMNLTGYVAGKEIASHARPLDPGLEAQLTDQAEALDITLVVGLAQQDPPGRIYPAQHIFFPDRVRGHYRKVHLAPNEKACFTAGNRIPVFSHPKACFGLQLCYDSHFPELTTTMALKGADLIIIPHASPRGDSKGKFTSWMRHLSARAFDNGIFVLAVNQTGDNGAGLCFPGVAVAIGPNGNTMETYLKSDESLVMVDLEPNCLDHVRSHRMRYFLPNRRQDLFPL